MVVVTRCLPVYSQEKLVGGTILTTSVATKKAICMIEAQDLLI